MKTKPTDAKPTATNPEKIPAVQVMAGTNQITVDYGTTVYFYISREGHRIRTGSHVATKDETIQISLEKLKYTLTINPTPSDATVTFN
ncbi:MAG: hypothetical protein LUF85_04480 [Bacteroides sp.]|nr:hypothetical protein [Bacteroides sp.]